MFNYFYFKQLLKVTIQSVKLQLAYADYFSTGFLAVSQLQLVGKII